MVFPVSTQSSGFVRLGAQETSMTSTVARVSPETDRVAAAASFARTRTCWGLFVKFRDVERAVGGCEKMRLRASAISGCAGRQTHTSPCRRFRSGMSWLFLRRRRQRVACLRVESAAGRTGRGKQSCLLHDQIRFWPSFLKFFQLYSRGALHLAKRLR